MDFRFHWEAPKLDYGFINDLKKFLEQYDVWIFSEHLSYTKTHNAHVYDLLPIPFRKMP